MVPLLDVNAQNHPLNEELTAAFQRVLGHGMFIMGREVDALEADLRSFLGVKHALAVSSGTDALVLALMALDVGPGDEVVCPAFTFFATAGSVARLGAVPVFADVCPICFNLDINDLHSKITDRTKAIIPVHLFGQSADMDPILALAAERGIAVLEDAAQSLGALYKGRQTGTMGQFGAYSFFPSKNLGALGDAGLLVTNDDQLAAKAKVLRVHGMEPKYYHQAVGGNFRIDALQSAFLAVKLRNYATYTSARQANATYYTERLASVPGITVADPAHCKCVSRQDAQLAAAEAKLVLPVAYAHNTHIWNQFTLRVLHGRRDALRQHLAASGIGCDIYYPVTLDQQECFQSLPTASRSGCEVAHRLASEVLSIPIYPELSVAQKDEVIAAIQSFVASV
jgi:dTDP-4-amino-4,6-dideoxygalactose transaminase